VEGLLAAPLVLVHVPYQIAVPATTIMLSLLPFLLMAGVAWRRGQSWLAALALLVPLALPVRYAILTGIPRGFVPGVALAIVPCLLLFRNPDPNPASVGKRRWRDRWELRYFLIGLLMTIALTLNPNCTLLVIGALVYLIGTQWRHMALWIFTSLGAVVGALHPLGIFLFYYVFHDDYRFHHRDTIYAWTMDDFNVFFHDMKLPLGDFVPLGLTHFPTDWVMASLFTGVLLYLLACRRWVAVAAALSAIGLTLLSFAYDRLHVGRETVYYSYSRMYLAVPVLWVWLLMLAAPALSPVPKGSLRQWLSRGLLAVLFCASIMAARQKAGMLESEVDDAKMNIQAVQLIDVAQTQERARQVQSAAAAEHAPFALLVGNDKGLDYLLPLFTDCQTLYPHYERRTWRLHEESMPRYHRILILDRTLF